MNQWGVDEIIIQDIDATARGNISIELLHKLTKYSYCPLTYAGGLNSVEDMVLAVREGADKVCINTALYDNSELLEEGAKILGNQCLVASIDYKKNSSNNWITYSNSGKQCQNIELVTWAKEIESKGAGEILINSIDRDGKKNGYDLEALQTVVEAVNIPVICCGGVGIPDDLRAGFECGASACAAANFFHFIEHRVNITKAYLSKKEIDVRLETHADYLKNPIGKNGRLLKKSDVELDSLRFEQVPKEVI